MHWQAFGTCSDVRGRFRAALSFSHTQQIFTIAALEDA
jgi:hypothetical protein